MAIVRRIRCEVSEIEKHGNGVYSIFLKPEKKLPKFFAGQFCHLTIDSYDPSDFWPESRVFSIASSPKDQSRLRICYSVVGYYTRRMEKELKEGALVWLKLPYGDFIVGEHPFTFLIAGGTGVSPFLPFIESLDDNKSNSIYLFYGVRNSNLFLDILKLKKIAKNTSHFRLILFSEDGFADHSDWKDSAFCYHIKGIINADVIISQILDKESTGFYISGPPKMLNFWKNCLANYGIKTEMIFMDAWE